MSLSSSTFKSTVASLDKERRAAFVRRAYIIVFGAVCVLCVGLFVALQIGAVWRFWVGVSDVDALRAAGLEGGLLGEGGLTWIGLLLGFVVGGGVAQLIARATNVRIVHALGFVLYVLLLALVLTPALMLLEWYVPGAILAAAIVTPIAHLGVGALILTTSGEVSLPRGTLVALASSALGVGVAGAIGGFGLGTYMVGAAVALMASAIAYETREVVHHQGERDQIGAALELLAAGALLLWIIPSFLISLMSDEAS